MKLTKKFNLGKLGQVSAILASLALPAIISSTTTNAAMRRTPSPSPTSSPTASPSTTRRGATGGSPSSSPVTGRRSPLGGATSNSLLNDLRNYEFTPNNTPTGSPVMGRRSPLGGATSNSLLNDLRNYEFTPDNTPPSSPVTGRRSPLGGATGGNDNSGAPVTITETFDVGSPGRNSTHLFDGVGFEGDYDSSSSSSSSSRRNSSDGGATGGHGTGNPDIHPDVKDMVKLAQEGLGNDPNDFPYPTTGWFARDPDLFIKYLLDKIADGDGNPLDNAILKLQGILD